MILHKRRLSVWVVAAVLHVAVGSRHTPFKESRSSLFVSSHRSLAASADTDALLDQCEDAVDTLYEENPAVNTAYAALSEAFEGSENCMANTLASGATARRTNKTDGSCTVNYATLAGGEPYQTYVEACDQAKGVLILLSWAIECSIVGYNFNFSLRALNNPSCIASTAIEPACDPDRIQEAIKEEAAALVDGHFSSSDSLKCSANFDTVADESGASWAYRSPSREVALLSILFLFA
jgi:hypothetical protein